MTPVEEAIAALELAEDVLSRFPFSTEIWPDGTHPNTGIERIRQALSRLRADGEGWRPIEEAPKDGTWFIAMQNGETYPCEWRVEEPDEGPPHEGWWDHFNSSFEEPTHFRPLPDPSRS